MLNIVSFFSSRHDLFFHSPFRFFFLFFFYPDLLLYSLTEAYSRDLWFLQNVTFFWWIPYSCFIFTRFFHYLITSFHFQSQRLSYFLLPPVYILITVCRVFFATSYFFMRIIFFRPRRSFRFIKLYTLWLDRTKFRNPRLIFTFYFFRLLTSFLSQL